MKKTQKPSSFLSLLLAVQGFGTAASAPPGEAGEGGALRGLQVQTKIVDGVPAPEYREGALVQKDGQSLCSGALVAPDMVLTAGHCIDALDAGQVAVEFPHLVGGVRRNARELINIFPTPEPWDFSELDVALIRLDADVDLGSYPYPILRGAAPGEDIRTLGRKQDGVEQTGEMFISAAQTIFAHNSSYYCTSPIITNNGDSGGPVFTADIVPGEAPNVIVAVNSGKDFGNDLTYFARVDAQMDLLESYVNPSTCSVDSSDVVRLQMHRLKMIRTGGITYAKVRYRVTFGGVASSWSDITAAQKGRTLPLDVSFVGSLTQHAQTHEGARDCCISGKIEVEERNVNIFGQWSTRRSVQATMSYCYDAADDRWELEGTEDTQGSENLEDGTFEIDLEWKAVRTRACSRIVEADPDCSTGIRRHAACCSAECGSCGGDKCNERQGGAEGCCIGDILSSDRSCNDHPPPCIEEDAPPDPTCSTGITGGMKACCAASCGSCGGDGCHLFDGGNPNCCVGTILGQGRSCDDFPPPCVMNPPADPDCSTGIRSHAACCSAECGSCGGNKCSERPGGAQGCCVGTILSNGRSCNNHPPPCVEEDAPPDPTCSTGIKGGMEACCAASCGSCGGDGCHLFDGGNPNCCVGTILGQGRSCDDFPPPCVMS